MTTMNKLVIYVTEEQRLALERLHAETDAPVAAIVRRAIDAYLKSKRPMTLKPAEGRKFRGQQKQETGQ